MPAAFTLMACAATAAAAARARRTTFPVASSAGSGADPCAGGTATTCGASAAFCAQACAWVNGSACVQVDSYPAPTNASLSALVGPGSPLIGASFITVSFYGDSITWLDLYEPLIAAAIAASPLTASASVRIINQGVNGGTLVDLIAGFSPWGHLNPGLPQTNISFAETLDQDAPDYVVVQIGINDVWQAGPSCGARCSNVSQFVSTFRRGIAAPVASRGMSLIIGTVSTIGERRDGGNALDAELDAFAAAQTQLAAALGVPLVNLRAVDEAYEAANNCLSLPEGVLTYDGVHPLSPRGPANLANQHAGGLLAAMLLSPPAHRPSPRPYGGRLFLTSAAYSTSLGGIAGADAACTAEAGAPAKALLVDESGCGGAPCRRASVTPFAGDGQLDWPLPPSRMFYTRDNATAVGYTDAHGLLSYPLYKPVDASCSNQASGLATDWTTRAGSTCESWTSAAPAAQDGVGWTCALDDGLFDGGDVPCGRNAFICVMA